MAEDSTQKVIANANPLSVAGWWAARILYLLIVIASPWYYGSVAWESQSHLVLPVAVVFLLSIGLAFSRGIRWQNPLVVCYSLLIVLALVQTLPLPQGVWSRTSTAAGFQRQLHNEETELKPLIADTPERTSEINGKISNIPPTHSIHWVQSRASLAGLTMALASLIAASILFREARWEFGLTLILGMLGLSVAMLGLVQLVAWNRWTLLPMPGQSHFATFVSRNAAPQLFAVGLGAFIGSLVWLAHNKTDTTGKKYYVRYPAVNILARLRRRLDDMVTDMDPVSIGLIIASTLMYVAILTTASRGGVIACGAATVGVLMFSLRARKDLVRSIGLVTVVASLVLLLTTSLDLDSAILERLDTLNQEAYELNNGRFTVWKMILSRPECWVLGCGLGNFHFAILPAYDAIQPSAWFYHAENIYIEVLAELGVAGFIFVVIGLTWLGLRLRQAIQHKQLHAPTTLATAFAVIAIGLQNMVDFSVMLPGIFLPLSALVGCFLGRQQQPDFGKKLGRERHSRSSQSSPRISQGDSGNPWVAACIVVTVLGAFAVSWSPLRGYVAAEQIQQRLNQLSLTNDADAGEIETQLTSIESWLSSIDVATLESLRWHPEFNLQVGRAMQAYAERLMLASDTWPEELNRPAIASLARPESVAAAFRTTSTNLEQLRTIATQCKAEQVLRNSQSKFLAAANMCCFDWRPAWGLYRSDLATLDAPNRAKILAILAKTTGQSISVPPTIGISSILADEKLVGIRFLKRFLERVPIQTSRLVLAIVDSIDESQLHDLVPDSPLTIVTVAEQLWRNPKYRLMAGQLTQSIDLKAAFSEARNLRLQSPQTRVPWSAIEWLAKEQGKHEILVEAFRAHISAEPMRHDLQYSCAVQLQSVGEIDEALKLAESALRLEPDRKEYRELVGTLKKQKSDGGLNSPKPRS